MITEEKLNKIYDGIINDKELTTKELNSYGLNSKDIYNLIEQGIIKRIKRGNYELLNFEGLYEYSKKLIKQKEYSKAKKCHKKIVEIEPTHYDSNFNLFLNCIYEDDYQSVYKYFDNIISTTNKFYHTDYNTYLFLLNFITDMPDKYKRYTKTLKNEQLIIDEKDSRYKNIDKNNDIRTAIIQRKFSYALQMLKELIKEKGYKTQQDIIISSLLYDVIVSENNDKELMIKYVKEKDYDSIDKLIKKKEDRAGLTNTEKLIKNLISDIKSIKNTKFVHKAYVLETNSVYEAIKGYNYALALKLCKSFNEKFNILNDNDITYILLEEICKMTIEIENSKNEIKLKYEKQNNENKVESKIEQSKEQVDLESKATLSDILNSLMCSDLEKALKLLNVYMRNINKNEYEFLITRLIKISLLQNDFAFIIPVTTLTFISRDLYTFDISQYIQDFYIALSENKLEEAEIYLDIIRNAKNMNINIDNIDKLQQALDMLKTKINKKNIVVETKEIIETKMLDEKVPNEHSKMDKKEEGKLPKFKKETINSEKAFLDIKYKELLKEKDIILLKPMDKDRRRIIHKLVETYPNMESFSIGNDDKRRIVLKYKKTNNKYVNKQEELQYGNIAYKNKQYKLCIEYYKKVLEISKPKAFMHYKIGLAYMMSRQKSKAIEHLTVALELGKQENKNFPIEDLLADLKGLISSDERKPKFIMKEEDFTSNIENYFGIENVSEVLKFIISSGYDVETACRELKIDEENINFIKLIIAKEYYSNNATKKGDEFLKSVEQSKNKSQLILEMLEKIRKNKKFYKYAGKNDKLKLTLTLKP